jgi:acyl-CoA reductase-like NAD-dependent aldehyde dehydrogenase
MPKGVFAMIQGNTNEVGATLVQHPDIKAVGFTEINGGKHCLIWLTQDPNLFQYLQKWGIT